MKQVDRYKLCVSPITGEAYISIIGKDGCMTDNRRKLEHKEVLNFIIAWLSSSLEENESKLDITIDKKPVVRLKLIRENLESKGE